MEYLVAVLAISIVVLLIVVRNLLIQVEKTENEVNKANKIIEETFYSFQDTLTKLKNVDRKGSFEADDEVGFIFTDIKDIMAAMQDKLYGSEEKEEKQSE